jgi:hypothetical protein
LPCSRCLLPTCFVHFVLLLLLAGFGPYPSTSRRGHHSILPKPSSFTFVLLAVRGVSSVECHVLSGEGAVLCLVGGALCAPFSRRRNLPYSTTLRIQRHDEMLYDGSAPSRSGEA